MSTFEVTFEKVGALSPIEGADRIERATLDGMDYSFVVKKGAFAVGDVGVYFPVDSIFPSELLEKIGMTGKLSGGQKNRVKTVRLRGMPSQGLLIPQAEIGVFEGVDYGKTLAELLGVTKYDHEATGGNINCKGNLPEHLSKFDIESAQKYKKDLSQYEQVVVEEKLEGSNLAAGVKADDSEFVCSRNFELKFEDENGVQNDWHKNALKHDLYTKAKKIKEKLGCKIVTLYGESLGPKFQGDYYELKELKTFIFDIKVDYSFLSPLEKIALCKEFDIPHVPVLFIGDIKEFLGEKTIVAAAHGYSELNKKKLREGIVIRPVNKIEGCERLLKLRCPIYLGETGAE